MPLEVNDAYYEGLEAGNRDHLSDEERDLFRRPCTLSLFGAFFYKMSPCIHVIDSVAVSILGGMMYLSAPPSFPSMSYCGLSILCLGASNVLFHAFELGYSMYQRIERVRQRALGDYEEGSDAHALQESHAESLPLSHTPPPDYHTLHDMQPSPIST
jgi:hypothetical protein